MVLPLAHLVCLLCLSADPRPLPVVITDLGASDYTLRESASDELTRVGTYKLADFISALKDPGLTAEQRMRLEGAAFRAFADSPRGALGVQFDQTAGTALISGVIKDFPAAAVLKPGDVITQIDGQQVSSLTSADGGTSAVRALIVSHDPGDEVTMVVQRAGLPVTLTVKLGDFTQLKSAAVYTYELHSAWEHRLERATGQTTPAAIDATSLRPRRDTNWSSGEVIDIVDAVATSRAVAGEVPSVAAGACPDQAMQIDRAEQARNGGGGMPGGPGLARAFNNRNVWNLGGGRVGGFGIGNDQRDLSKLSDNELAADRLRLSQWLQSFAMIAGQQEISRGQRKQFIDMQNQTMQQLNALSREIDKRKAERRDAVIDPAPAPAPALAPDSKPDQKADKP